jgi:hypothetical protein
MRTELVEGPVGPYARGFFRYPCATGETGFATVARAGIEPRKILASGRPGKRSKGELKPWTGQNEMCSTSLCLASWRHSRQINPLRSLHAIPNVSILQPNPFSRSLAPEEAPTLAVCAPTTLASLFRRPGRSP